MSNQDAVLKDYYTDDKLKEQTYGENPFFAFVKKERGVMAGGRRYVQPVEFANPGGASADYTEAMANNTASQYEDFLIPRKKQYQKIKVDHELLFATQNQRESFRKALDEFDRGLKSLGEKVGRRMYRTQGGAIGQMANSTVATTVIQLAEKSQAFNFHIGQILQLAIDDGLTAVKAGTLTVTGVDIENAQVTVSGNISAGVATAAVSDYVFAKGDYASCLAGLEDWLPVLNRSTKLAASFNSVVRSPAPDYLGGIYMDGTGMGGLDEVIIKLCGKLGKYGASTSHIFANPESLSDLELISNSKMRIVSELQTNIRGEGGELLVGFSGYKAVVAGRTVKVYGDRNCPSDRLYALQLNTWTLWHTGELVNWLGEQYTGSKLQPDDDTSDAAVARLGSYMNVGCSAPGWNGVAKINPAA
jgi:hypothetical protein